MIRLPWLELCLAILLGLVCTQTSNAAIVVDQMQLSENTTIGAFDGGFANVQSFQQTFNNITGSSIGIRNVPIGTVVTIRLYDLLGSTSNPANAIASGSVTTTATSSSVSQIETVSFGGPVFITPGQTYFLSFEKATGSNLGGFVGSSTNPYANGRVFSDGNEPGFANLDYVFQTFADDAAVAVPEPSSAMLLGVGLAFVSMRRRRK